MQKQSIITFIILSFFLIESVLSSKCINAGPAGFTYLLPSEDTKFNVGPEEEACYQYSLGSPKNKLSLYFLIDNSYTLEVLVYKKYEEIQQDQKGDYTGYILSYKPVYEQYKEIDVSIIDSNDVFIIIRDSSYYYYSDYLKLFDSESVLNLVDGTPLTFRHFMSTNVYKFYLDNPEGYTLFYSTNKKGSKKEIIIDNGVTTNKSSDSHYTEVFTDNLPVSITVTKIGGSGVLTDDENEDDYFSIIVYKNYKKYNYIESKSVLSTNYIYFNDDIYYYFYADISNFQNMGTVNFKLDYTSKTFSNIKISSKILTSNSRKSAEDFLLEEFPEESNLPQAYDTDSDENFRLYFNKIETEVSYKYVLVRLIISPPDDAVMVYYEPKKFSVSIGEEVGQYDFRQLQNYKKKEISQVSESINIPLYFKMVLDPDSKYVFTAPYQGNLLFIKGSLLTNENTINEDILEDEKDLIMLTGISELTVRILSNPATLIFYLEKIDSNAENDIIKEGTREDEAITIPMTKEDCDNNIIKHIIGTYDKDTYADGGMKASVYATVDEGAEIEVYYKNYFDPSSESLFPLNEDEKKEIEKIFILENNIDIFSIKCSKPGNLYIRPYRKTFTENTHLIKQNSIQTLILTEDIEILQLSSPIRNPKGKAYVSILLLKGKEVTISADTPYVFESKIIKDNEVFNLEVDLEKYRMDQLAIKVQNLDSATVEVIEVIPGEHTTYNSLEKGEHKDLKSKNFFVNINSKIDKVKFKINGLKDKMISYGIVKALTNDTNYLPLAYNFQSPTKIKVTKDEEVIEISNPYLGEEDEVKKYQIFVFSIMGEKNEVKYNAMIELIEKKEHDDGDKDKDKDEEDNDGVSVLVVVLIIVFAILLLAIVIVVIIMVKKKSVSSQQIENDNDKKERLPSSFTNYPEGSVADKEKPDVNL